MTLPPRRKVSGVKPGHTRGQQENKGKPTSPGVNESSLALSVQGVSNMTVTLTKREATKLRRIHRAMKCRDGQEHASFRKSGDERMVVDSGASKSFVKSSKWLKELRSRIKLTVQNATGGKSSSAGHGKVKIRVLLPDGTQMDLKRLGEAYHLPNLTYSLLSVSSLCKKGFSVKFTPEGAWIITPERIRVKLEQEEGLYFLPTAKVQVDAKRRKTRSASEHEPKDCARAKMDARTRRCLKALKWCEYDQACARSLGLGGVTIPAVLSVAHAEARLARYKRRAKKFEATAMLEMDARAERAARREKTRKLDPAPKRGKGSKSGEADKGKKPKAPAEPEWTQAKPGGKHASNQENISVFAPPKALEKWAHRRCPSARSVPSKAKRAAKSKDARKSKPTTTPRKMRENEVANKTADDPAGEATKLKRQIQEAKNLLENANSRLADAVRDNALRQSDDQRAAADRELARVREWHRVHRIMCHASKEDTDKAYLDGTYARGQGNSLRAVFKKLPHHTEKYCSVCLRGKFTKRGRKLFQDELKARRPGEVVHADLVGPLPEATKGERYMCTFTDAASGKMWVYAIRRKKFAVECLEKLLKDMKFERVNTAKDHKLEEMKVLISDRGGEFTSRITGGVAESLFNRVCKKHGIKQLFTSAYTSKHNGKAERTNRTISEGMRCALLDSGMKWAWWPEAAKHACFTLNRIVRVKTGSSAHQRYCGLRPDSKNLIPFGQTGECALDKPKNKKGKMVKSIHVRMIGYPENSKGYEVIDKKGRRITLEHVEWGHARDPLKEGYTTDQDEMVKASIEHDPRKVDDHVEAPIDQGIIQGLEDHQVRNSANRTGNEAIQFERPIHHAEVHKEGVFRQVDASTGSASHIKKDEARDMLTKWAANKGVGYELEFQNENPKGGQSRTRYEIYKSARTYNDYRKLLSEGKIKGPKTGFGTGDLLNDFQKGFLKITKVARVATANIASSSSEDDITDVNLRKIQDGFDPDPALLVDKMSESQRRMHCIQHADAYCTELKQHHEDDEFDIKRVNSNLHQAEDRSTYMAAMLENLQMHLAAPGADNDIDLNRNEFAQAMHREIVCGKTTPLSDKEARESEDWELWRDSIKLEQAALQKMGTFELCPRSKMLSRGKKPKSVKNVYKIKTLKDGNIERFKCRMVVRGFSLHPNDEFHESYSSVMSPATMRLMAYLEVQSGEVLSSADVGNAFLEADLPDTEEIYIEIHPDAEIEGYPRADWVFRLRKCLYGLPQSGRGFQREYNKVMHGAGFVRSKHDDCLWVKHDPIHGRIMCSNYVDDLLCLTASEHLRDWWRALLLARFAKVTFEDIADYMLGIRLDRGTDKNGMKYIELSHEASIDKMADAAQVKNHRRVDSPMDPTTMRKKKEGEDDLSKYKPPYEYASVLGSVMYIANMTRPDLVTAVNKLSRFTTNPSHTHFKALTRLIAFTYQTRGRKLRYTQTPHDVEHDPFRLQVACDSSFADCPDTQRSTVGRCMWMGRKCSGLIDWKSHLPAQVAQSTTEAEVQAAIEVSKDVIYMRGLLYGIGYPQKGSTRAQIDSTSCIQQLNALSGVSKARHYLVALRKVQEVRHLGIMHTHRVDTSDNVADLFTKPLTVMPFWRLSSRVMGDKYADHSHAEFRDEALRQEIGGGSIKGIRRNLQLQQRMTASDGPMAVDDKAQRKREEMEGKRLSTVANIMSMQLAKSFTDMCHEIMSKMSDSSSDDD